MDPGQVQLDPRVPAYLGRVLDAAGEPAGTCFQVADGVLVTAAHVLEALGTTDAGDVVSVDPLRGGAQREATVARVDALSDLAVLITAVALEASVVGLSATDHVALNDDVVVTGVSRVDDPDHEHRYLDATGIWAGGSLRDDQIPLGRMTASAVALGMSGAPVRRLSDGHVVGIVSARYNSANGWLRDSVWVARTEHLEALLASIASVTVLQPAQAGRLDLVLTIDEAQVRLTGAGRDVVATHRGVGPGLKGAVDDVRRRRARVTYTRREPDVGDGAGGTLALARAGELLAASFLPPAVSEALRTAVTRAEAANQGLRIGIDVRGDLARLPWEALPTPGGTRPLALHPLIDVYRRGAGQSVRPVPGPLRILIAISSPENGDGAVLDYERELRNVTSAVRAARAGDAHVRVVRFANTAAIRSALEAEEVHVLHISAHGSPGVLVLEDDDGKACPLDADHFVETAIPPGRMPPLVCLAACYTNVAQAADAPSFAARLLERGAAAVVATETSVTDRYATHLFARIYGRLAESPRPDVVGALCEARRAVQASMDAAPEGPDRVVAALDEWAVVTMASPGPTVDLYDPATTVAVPPSPQSPRIGLVAGRETGDFVGRRQEQRHWPADLLSSKNAGLVLWGIGGIGKTTLASELVAIVGAREPQRLLAQLRGEISVEDVLGAVADAVRRPLLMAGDHRSSAARALEVVARRDIPWRDRLALLAEHVFSVIPLLVVLDNFEDNLLGNGQKNLADQDLAAFLAAWTADPKQSRLLVTCRYRFSLPGSAEARLAFRRLGPLSRAETAKLVWSLPALDRLSDAEVDDVWRRVGGHPRSLEYLDALLSKGAGRYSDITARLTESLQRKLGPQEAAAFLAAERTLDAALADTAVLAADDVLLADLLKSLTAQERDLLLGASIFREPVDRHALAYQVGEQDEAAAHTPDYKAARERISELLAAAGMDASTGPIDAAALPPALLTELKPHLAELKRRPTPPRTAPDKLTQQVSRIAQTTLLTTAEEGDETTFFVHRWTASELERQWHAEGRSADLTAAHRKAAQYWQWRARVCAQSRQVGIHDLLEARHHVLAVGDTGETETVTERICSRLHDFGSWDQEAVLAQDMLQRLPKGSERRGAWIHRLGILAQDRGNYEEAERRYKQALEINEQLGNLSGMASNHGQLGILAHLRGNYEEAERRCRRALEIYEGLGDRSGMATSYGELGILARSRGDYEEAERRLRQALEIDERLGNRKDMATGYHQLGILAQDRGNYEEAERRYKQALEINEQLGNLSGMASNHGQLGILFRLRGDYREAELRFRRSLEINERLGDLAGMALGYHNIGILAHSRGDYEEAERRYKQALEINEGIGDSAGIASGQNNLGALAQLRGDYEEAERRCKQALEINEGLGDPIGMASGQHNLGALAQLQGDYEEAERRYRQSLEINERLGNFTGMASGYSQLGILVALLGDDESATGWHVKALRIRMRLGEPQASINLRQLHALRARLGRGRFTELLAPIMDLESRAALEGKLDQVPGD